MKIKKGQTTKATKLFLANGLASDNAEMDKILEMMEKLLHWAAIIDSSDDAIISKSVDGYITSWNRGAQQLYGYTPEEVIGQPVSILMPPEKKDDFPFIMKQLHEGKKVEHYETERMTKDGKKIHVSITVSPIKDKHGNIIGASKIARDITERIEDERRRNEFVMTASHELRTPLTSQKAFGELLEKTVKQKQYTELQPLIQKINLQTEKLNKLVEDLLDLSRVQTARLRMEHKLFDFDSFIQEQIENIQPTTAHKIFLKGKINKKVKGDRERLSQVVLNLLSNAIKYSPNGEKINVTVRANRKEIIVSIQDFGIGIAKEYQQKIFERFFRVMESDQKYYPGMGIGLFLCEEIVRRHGGLLWVESSLGKGSTFYFSVPLP